MSWTCTKQKMLGRQFLCTTQVRSQDAIVIQENNLPGLSGREPVVMLSQYSYINCFRLQLTVSWYVSSADNLAEDEGQPLTSSFCLDHPLDNCYTVGITYLMWITTVGSKAKGNSSSRNFSASFKLIHIFLSVRIQSFEDFFIESILVRKKWAWTQVVVSSAQNQHHWLLLTEFAYRIASVCLNL